MHVRAETEKTTFLCKDDCTLYIDEAHTALDIFRFAVFFNYGLTMVNFEHCRPIYLCI